MNGTYKCSRNYRALALSILGGIGLAAFAFPAIASNQVNVNVNPTTGYYEVTPRTYRVPPNARVGGLPSVPTVSAIPPGGLGQSITSGIEITALKSGNTFGSTINATVRAGSSALKNGAVRCLTSLRCNLALTGGALGLEALLDGLGWIMDEGGQIQIRENTMPEGELPKGITSGTAIRAERAWTTDDVGVFVAAVYNPIHNYTYRWYCPAEAGPYAEGPVYPMIGVGSNRCFYGEADPLLETSVHPVSDVDIQAGVNQHYAPHPSDWSWLTGGLDLSAPDVDIEVLDIPSLSGAGSPDYIEWSDGTSQGTYSELDFSVTGSPGKQPSISARETTTSTDYDAQGNPTGSTTSTTNISSSSSVLPPAETPTDCEFMPTVCRFIDWFTEPDPSPDPDGEIRDLVQVYEDGGRQVELGPSMGSCPPPRTIALSFVPAVEVSFQPFCDLAAAVRFWLLAIAYFGAAYLTVRSI